MINVIIIDPTAVGSLAELRIAAINTAQTKRDRRAATRRVITLLKSLTLLPSEWKGDVLVTQGSDKHGRPWFAVVHNPGPEAVEVIE